jgi:hypothetical protein
MLPKQDKLLMVLSRLVKKVIGKWCYIKKGKEKNTHTWDRWTGDWKMMLYQGGETRQASHGLTEAQRKPSLSDCTWLESEYGSFNLEALKFLMHFREPGSSPYFYFYTYSYFFFFSYISFFLSFFLSFSHFFLFFFLIKFFICSPLNSKIALYLPPPPWLDVACPQAKRR